jgi:hypothetical protein
LLTTTTPDRALKVLLGTDLKPGRRIENLVLKKYLIEIKSANAQQKPRLLRAVTKINEADN